MEKKTCIIIVLCLMLAGTIALLLARSGVFNNGDTWTVSHDTIIQRDTVLYVPPVTKDSVIGNIVRTLPVYSGSDTSGSDTSGSVSQAIAIETCSRDSSYIAQLMEGKPPDSTQVIIPISQKKYEDKYYTAWVSGYEANLDSIKLYQESMIVTKKSRRWNMMIGIGAGAGTKGLVPYVGVMFGYTLFQ